MKTLMMKKVIMVKQQAARIVKRASKEEINIQHIGLIKLLCSENIFCVGDEIAKAVSAFL